ncbi:MAG: hypothetical protein VB118_01390 [Oscillospiraceae bacterium]|nr:hypothetical protein [Oscillospiraceae bacterium]
MTENHIKTGRTRHLIRQAACKRIAYDPLHYGVLSSDGKYSVYTYRIT